jgi:cytochrome-b5 reductase
VQFKIYFTVDIAPPAEAKWTEGVGFMTKEMIKEHMPAPGPDTMILFCGPPPFTKMLSSILPELGYTEDMLFKF